MHQGAPARKAVWTNRASLGQLLQVGAELGANPNGASSADKISDSRHRRAKGPRVRWIGRGWRPPKAPSGRRPTGGKRNSPGSHPSGPHGPDGGPLEHSLQGKAAPDGGPPRGGTGASVEHADPHNEGLGTTTMARAGGVPGPPVSEAGRGRSTQGRERTVRAAHAERDGRQPAGSPVRGPEKTRRRPSLGRRRKRAT